jgi:hypothetical protein
MGHQDRNVVACVADVAVQNQALPVSLNVTGHRFEELGRRSDMAADGADICLESALMTLSVIFI